MVVEVEDIRAVAIFGIGIGIFEIGTETAIAIFEMLEMDLPHSAVILTAIGVAATGTLTPGIHGSASVAVAPVPRRLLATFAT